MSQPGARALGLSHGLEQTPRAVPRLQHCPPSPGDGAKATREGARGCQLQARRAGSPLL